MAEEHAEWVLVGTFSSVLDADFARQQLDAEGIPALVKSDRGQTVECWQNVYTILKHHPAWVGVIGFDAFAQRVMKRKAVPGVVHVEMG